MADVTVRIVTTIADEWGSAVLDLTERYEGQGDPLRSRVDSALSAAVDRVREFVGSQAVQR